MTSPRIALFLFQLLVIALAVFAGFPVTIKKIVFGIAPAKFALFLFRLLVFVLAAVFTGFRVTVTNITFGIAPDEFALFLGSSATIAVTRVGFRIKAFFG